MSESEMIDGEMGEVRRVEPGRDGGKRRSAVRFASAAFACICLVSVAFGAWAISLGPLPLERARQVSTTVVDRNGKLLRAYAMADGRWRLPVDARKDVDPTYLNLLLAYEDQRFRSHGGVDPLALAMPRASSSPTATSCPAARPSQCSSHG